MRGKNKISRILSIFLVFILISSPVMASFHDMPNNWSKEALEHAVNNKILQGYGNGKINPDGNLTRAEMATMISRLLNLEEKADLSSFKDVSKDKWYYEDISKAVKAGILEGNKRKELKPNSKITREESFAMLSRMLVLEKKPNSLEAFKDKDRISDWAFDSVNSLVSEGYVEGNKMKELKPREFITRAEMAQLIYNILPNIDSSIENINYKGNLIVNNNIKELKNIKIDGDLILADGVKVDELILKDVNVKGRVLVRNSSSLQLKGNTEMNKLLLLKKSEVNIIRPAKIGNLISFKPVNLKGEANTVEKVLLKDGSSNSIIFIPNIYIIKDDKVGNVKDRNGNIVDDSNIIINKDELEIPVITKPEEEASKFVKLKKLNPIIVESQIPGVSPMFSVEKEELKKHFKNVNKDSIFNIKIEDKNFTLKYNSRSEVFQIYEDEDLEYYSLIGYDKNILLEAIVSILD